MIKYFTIPILMILFGCGMEELPMDKTLELEFDDKQLIFSSSNLVVNENCGQIFINASNSGRLLTKFELKTDGQIGEVILVDYSDDDKHYKTADFNASREFFITNFDYTPLDGSISFDYQGTLYEVDKSGNNEIHFRQIIIQ